MNSKQIVGRKSLRAMSAVPPDPADKDAADREEELDEGLEETFPASDPPAHTQPGHGRPTPSPNRRN